jgi:hypothetical protein
MGSPKAWSAMTNRKPARDRLGALGWRISPCGNDEMNGHKARSARNSSPRAGRCGWGRRMSQPRTSARAAAKSALPPVTDILSSSRHVAKVPILLQKSFWGEEQKFLEPLMRFARDDVRDHIG